MRSLTLMLAASAMLGCATTPRMPAVGGDPAVAIRSAEQQIQQAVEAGADSLAAQVMASARQNLARARVELEARRQSDAIVAADVATADARYARAEARRLIAERAREAARAALAQLQTPGGGQ